MTLATAFSDLGKQLGTLRESVVGLRLAAVEDRPKRRGWEPELIRKLGVAADDIQGYLEHALMAAKEGRQAVEEGMDLERVRRALVDCQTWFHSFVRTFSADLYSYGPLVDLSEFEKRREREWREWATVVQTTLGDCQGQALGVNQTLFECWQELVERAGSTSVSVKATSIGKQVLHSTNLGTAQQRRSGGMELLGRSQAADG